MMTIRLVIICLSFPLIMTESRTAAFVAEVRRRPSLPLLVLPYAAAAVVGINTVSIK